MLIPTKFRLSRNNGYVMVGIQGGWLAVRCIKKALACNVAASAWWWALTDSNRRPSACKADALNQLS